MPDQNAATYQSEVEKYIARMRAYVEGKDPLAVQRETPEAIARLIENASASTLSVAPAPGKWSVRAIIGHLAEVEIASSWRYRQILEKSGVGLAAFDQDEWARRSSYDSWDCGDSLTLFRLLRATNVRLLEGLAPEEWHSFGNHSERGRLTLRELVTQMAGHDLNHIEQIRRIVSPDGSDQRNAA